MSGILSGKRTYITLIAGILATWGAFLLGATCGPVDPVVVDATAATCKQFAGVQISLGDAVVTTWAAVAGGFARSAIK